MPLPYALRSRLKNALHAAGLDVTRHYPRGREKLPAYLDPAFMPLYRKFCDKTMVPWQGLYAAYSAARHIALNGIPGDIVECGVWKGGCMAIMAETIAQCGGAASREFYLYDTFTGMSEPGQEDRHSSGRIHAADLYRKRRKDTHVDWSYSPRENVEALIRTLTPPVLKFHLVEGRVEETIPGTIPQKIALLRLDTDWYASTLHELTHLLPRLQPGGFLMVDDYGSWAGAKQAVDEYFSAQELYKRMHLHIVHGHGSVIGQLRV